MAPRVISHESRLTVPERVLITVSWVLFFLTLPFSAFACIWIINEYNRLVVFRLGKIRNQQLKGPGLVIVLPYIDSFELIDLRVTVFDVPSQELLTRDSVPICVDAVIYYKIFDPIACQMRVWDPHSSTRLFAQTSLRNSIGLHSLGIILSNIKRIESRTMLLLNSVTMSWGFEVLRVEIKDIRLPGALCRKMAAIAEAHREADAKLVAASGELKASEILAGASTIYKESCVAMQLRFLQSLLRISNVKNHTLALPIPLEFLQKANFFRKDQLKRKNMRLQEPDSPFYAGIN